MIILPRQARDKHRGTQKKSPAFLQVEYFIAAVTTTVAMPAGYDTVAAATAEYTAAEANASSLLSTHVSEWQTIWQDGGETTGAIFSRFCLLTSVPSLSWQVTVFHSYESS